MNWFLIGAGAAIVIGALHDLRRRAMPPASAWTLAGTGAVFVAMGADWL